MSFLRSSVIGLFIAAWSCLLRAAPGEPDPGYDVRASGAGTVRAVARQPDGKLLIAGDFVYANGVRRPNIARLNADGSTDATFNAGEGVTNPFTYDTIHALAVQADGRILVGGFFSEFNHAPASNLIRLNADGSRDSSFTPGSISYWFDPTVFALAVQSDGSILVGGRFDSIGGVSKANLARFNGDGTLDTDFAIDADGTVLSIVPDGSSGWLIGGGFSTLGGQPRSGLARLQADGAVDAAFVPDSEGSLYVYAIRPMSDGRILCAGAGGGFVRRLLNTGATDAAFTPPSIGGAWVEDVVTLGNGSILLGGIYLTADGIGNGGLVTLSPDGTPDVPQQVGVGGPVFAFLPLPDGSAIFGGGVFAAGQQLRLGIGMIRPDGTLDPLFHPDVTIATAVHKIATISGGRSALAGRFEGVHSATARGAHVRLSRLAAAGQPDSSFAISPTGDFFSLCTAVGEQSDGRLVAAGESYSAAVPQVLRRFNANGTLDSGFTVTLGNTDPVEDLLVQPDDRIIFAGSITRLNGSARTGVIRLLADGTPDPSFASTGLGPVMDLALAQGGKIVVAGNNFVARLQPDGTRDPSFNSGFSTNGPVLAVAVLPGQRLLVAGDFTAINGLPAGRVARLLANGNLDSTFSAGAGADAAVRAIAVRSDGEIFLTGDFQGIDGLVRRGLAQLAPDGAVRTGFDPLLGLNAPGFTLAVDASGSVLVGGAFTAVNGVARFGLARVQTAPAGTPPAPPPAPATFTATAVARNRVLLVWSPVPSAAGFAVERSANGTSGWLALGSVGAGATSFTDITAAPGQTYFYRVVPWNSGGDAPPGAGTPVSLPMPDTLAGGLLPSGGLDLWTNGDVRAVRLQPDGKFIVAGRFTRVMGVARTNVARLNADGTVDPTFDAGSGPPWAVNVVDVQPDGRIVLGGGDSSRSVNFVERYLADGTRDPSFNVSTRPNNAVNCLVVLPDGSIVVGGAFRQWGVSGRDRLARLNPDGSFVAADGLVRPSDTVYALALQGDGKLIVGGSFTYIDGIGGSVSNRTRVARLNANGTLDTTFAAADLKSGSATGTVLALGLQADGKLLVGGSFTALGTGTFNRILRLTAAGAVDATFDAGTGASDSVHAVTELGDGRIAVGGSFLTFNGSSRRGFAVLSSTGGLHGTELAVFPPSVRALLPVGSGQCLVAGPIRGLGGVRAQGIARVLADGSTVDSTFLASTSREGLASAMTAQPDGKTLIVGNFTSVGGPDHLGIPRYDVLRLRADDSIDAGFEGTFGFAGSASAVACGVDGRIWIGGSFTAFGDSNRNRVARFLPDGTLDPSFDAGAGPNSTVNTLFPEADGGVTLGGFFTSVAGQARGRLARLASDGSLASDFSSGGTSDFVAALVRQPDGRLVVGGFFSSIQSQARRNLARLNADGAVDSSFAPEPDGSIADLLSNNDGTIMAAGYYKTIGGATRNGLARLLLAGGVDPAYIPALDSSSSVTRVIGAPDGKGIVLGTLNGPLAHRTLRVARLLQDGALDPEFDAGIHNDVAPSSGVASPTRLLLGGSFRTFGGQPRVGLVRLRNQAAIAPPAAPVSVAVTALSATSVSLQWQHTGGGAGYVIERSPQSAASWQPIATTGADQTGYTDSGLAAGGTWQYRIRSFNAAGLSDSSAILPITAPTSFAQWRAALGIPPAITAGEDLDGDGLGILAEYALGLRPWIADPGGAPAVALADGQLQLTYFRADTEAILVVQTSETFVDWTTEGVHQGGTGPWVTATVPKGTSAQKFLRLFIAKP